MRPLLAIGLSLVSVLSSAVLVSGQTPNALNRVGYFAELAGELDLAESMWRQKIGIVPDDVEPYLSLGHVLLEKENWVGAQAVFEGAVNADAENESAYIGLGSALRRQGKFEQAQAAFDSAIELNARAPLAYSLLGRMQRDRKQFTEATATFQTILQLEPAGPNAATAYWDLGKTFAAQSNDDAAELAYRRAIGLNRNNLEFWQSLAGVVRNQGRTSEMASIAGEISRIKDSDPLRNLEEPPLQARYGTERYRTQVAEAQAILQAYPDNVSAYLELGRALPKLGQFVEAEAALQQATQLSPNNPKAHYLLSEVLMNLGREQASQAAYRVVQQLYPEIDESPAPLEQPVQPIYPARIDDYIELPAPLLTLSRPATSLVTRIPAARVRPQLSVLPTLPRAVPSRSPADLLRWNPDSAALQGREGERLRSQGKLSEAETAFREMARLDPRQAVTAYNNLGVVLYEQDKVAEAETALTEAMRQPANPSPQAYLNLATVFKKQGRWGEAATLYQSAKRQGLDAQSFRSWNDYLLEALTASARLTVTEGGSPQRAERAYRSAIRLATDDDTRSFSFTTATLYDELATLLFSQGQLQAAEALYTEAIAAYPQRAFQMSNGLIQVLSAQGRTEEANALAERYRASAVSRRLPSIPLPPSSLNSRSTYTPLRPAPSLRVPSITSFEPSIPAPPSPTAIAQNAFGQKKLAQGRYYHAEFAFNEALRNSPSYADTLVNAGLALMYQGKRAEAENALKKAIALNPDTLKCYSLPPQADAQPWQLETYLQTGEACLPLLLK